MSGPRMNRVVGDFKAAATGDKTIRLKDLRGKNVVIYFYPKDSTPGCTTEGRDFSALHAKFRRARRDPRRFPRQHRVSREIQGKTGVPVRPVVGP